MDKKAMLKQVVDSILDIAQKQHYKTASSDVLNKDFYKAMEELFNSDQTVFIEVTEDLLMDSVPYLEREDIQVQMNCAGLWCQDAFCIYVFRARFFLSVENEKTLKYLKRKLRKLLIDKDDFVIAYDRKKVYFNFFYTALVSNSEYDAAVKHEIQKLLLPDFIQDAESVVFYVDLKYALKQKDNIPRTFINVYHCVGGLSEIENSGLAEWSIYNRITGLKRLVKALIAIGEPDISILLNEYTERLTSLQNLSNAKVDELFKRDINHVNKIANDYEKALYNQLNMEDFIETANEYLKNK